MNELMIYDVSAMVYRGGSHKEEYYGYPVGGIHYVMNHLAVALNSRDKFILCFDSPSFRSSMDEKYKSGREKRPAIYSQIETIYDGLQQCGIRCEKHSGYEADDIIEWAVEQNYAKFIRGTTIYCNDMDLCHSIRNGVMLKTLSPEMNDISAANFETGIYLGKKIPYNTISAYKVFCGCSSDKIPVLTLESGWSGYALFNKWCEMISQGRPLSDRSVGANPKFVEIFAKASGIFTEGEITEVQRRIKLVYPAAIPDGVVVVPNEYSDVNMSKLESFLSRYGARDALKCLGMKYTKPTDWEKQQLADKAKALKSGAYAADKNLEHVTKSVRSTLVDLDSFSRGF